MQDVGLITQILQNTDHGYSRVQRGQGVDITCPAQDNVWAYLMVAEVPCRIIYHGSVLVHCTRHMYQNMLE